MPHINFEETVKKVLTENGIYTYDTFDDEPMTYDSLTFISVVVGMENELGFEVIDDMLVDYPKTYNEWVEFIRNAFEAHQNQMECV